MRFTYSLRTVFVLLLAALCFLAGWVSNRQRVGVLQEKTVAMEEKLESLELKNEWHLGYQETLRWEAAKCISAIIAAERHPKRDMLSPLENSKEISMWRFFEADSMGAKRWLATYEADDRRCVSVLLTSEGNEVIDILTHHGHNYGSAGKVTSVTDRKSGQRYVVFPDGFRSVSPEEYESIVSDPANH